MRRAHSRCRRPDVPVAHAARAPLFASSTAVTRPAAGRSEKCCWNACRRRRTLIPGTSNSSPPRDELDFDSSSLLLLLLLLERSIPRPLATRARHHNRGPPCLSVAATDTEPRCDGWLEADAHEPKSGRCILVVWTPDGQHDVRWDQDAARITTAATSIRLRRSAARFDNSKRSVHGHTHARRVDHGVRTEADSP